MRLRRRSKQQLLAAAVYDHDRRARERIDRWWAAGGTHRDEVWRSAWFLLTSANFRFGNHERPARVVPVLEFLLEDDPTSPYQPQNRLTACLPLTAVEPANGLYLGDPSFRQLVDAALGFPDLALRQRMADLLSVTDQPGLLDAMEAEFRQHARLGPTYVGSEPGRDTRCRLWLGGEPHPLLQLVAANPHLPRPPAQPDDLDLALLALLKDRLDLLPAFDQAALAVRLLEYLGTWLPEEIHARCRRALRELPAEGAAAVCEHALRGNAEAIAAVRHTGYLPTDPAWIPLHLLLTDQFAAYREADPNALVLQLLSSPYGQTVPADVVIDRILALLKTSLPRDVAAAVRRSLRDLAPAGNLLDDFGRRGLRKAILDQAIQLNPEAVAAVVDAGYLPEGDEDLLPLLFLTEQFERYDHEDPDGTKLPAALAKKRYAYEHNHFRTVAKRAGRPDPWPPAEPSPPSNRSSTQHVTTYPSSYGADSGGHNYGGHF
ncbi:hypothetical protein GCM10009745_83130 [Kribbella yunnanensis]|uniref:HEAT repeat domain-containing protein n=1 Tax=Kribbella yunnanensis TaxID=190194 RepID=A0ABN2JB00_9ACTN